ncbi:MAG TPA: hypothetical protein VJO15_03485, partial [Dehalococcoidia bacterium]|nr:hypothetical protein [Dehalococcoidia bacterium]
GAMTFGDVNDPRSEISRLLAGNPIQVLKPEKDTRPHAFYIAGDMVAMRTMGGPWGDEEKLDPIEGKVEAPGGR